MRRPGIVTSSNPFASMAEALKAEYTPGVRLRKCPQGMKPFKHQIPFIDSNRRYALACSGTKAGKLQPLHSKVYTPTGPKRMGDVAVGDEVLTADGTIAIVNEIFPQGEKDIYEVRFADGTIVEAGDDHLWEIEDFDSLATARARSGKKRVATTRHLRGKSTKKLRRTWVPLIAPVAFRASPVPVDPYALGLLIGDGGMTTDSVIFTSADDQLVESLRAVLPTGHSLSKTSGKFGYGVRSGFIPGQSRGAGYEARARGSLKHALIRLGLHGKGSHEKFIPRQYKYNSVDVRLGVLRGILDTDGFVDERGQPHLEQTSPRLADDVREVVESLGGSVLQRVKKNAGYKKNGSFVQCRDVYRQAIRLPGNVQCFRLERKANAIRPKKKPGYRVFDSITYKGKFPAQCISISDPRGLYLTDGLIPTHNSKSGAYWLVKKGVNAPATRGMWIAPSYEQATKVGMAAVLELMPTDDTMRTVVRSGVPTVTLCNGTTFEFKSADTPDNIFGHAYDYIVVDEAGRISEAAWDAIRSTVTATHGPIRLLSNPTGKTGWFYRLYLAGLDGNPSRDVDSFKWRTADNPLVPKEELEDARRHTSEQTYRYLYEGEFMDVGGTVFRGVRECATATPREPERGHNYVIGLDLARTMDWTVAIVVDIDERYVVGLHRWHGSAWKDTVERVKVFSRKYNNATVRVDSTGLGDPVLEMIERSGVPALGYKFSSVSKQRLVERLASLIEKSAIRIPQPGTCDAAEILIAELESFEGTTSEAGTTRYSAPDGAHDDTVVALALAALDLESYEVLDSERFTDEDAAQFALPEFALERDLDYEFV